MITLADRGGLLLRLYRLLFVLPPSSAARGILAKLQGRTRMPTNGVEAPGAHPIDEIYSIDTSGVIGYHELRSGKMADVYSADYGPSQPSIIRKAIAQVPDVTGSLFIDIGCGKGRALAVASEFPFREIVGIELVSALAETARDNAKAIHHRFPERPPIRIIEGDAATTPLPDGHLVIFMFHPFFEKIMRRVIGHITEFVERNPDNKAYVIYYNPVYWKLFDRSRHFERIFAQEIEYEHTEMGARNFHDDRADTVVIWQTHHVRMAERHESADAKLTNVDPAWKAKALNGHRPSRPDGP